MKLRSTFLVSDPESAHPDNFAIQTGAFHAKSLPAIREDRYTVGYNELPTELWHVLKQCNELVVRWSTGRPYQTSNPYGSRVASGLHVLLVPQRKASPPICSFLNSTFGVTSCSDVEHSFVSLPGILQFYDPLPSASALRPYLERILCKNGAEQCKERLILLERADYVDLKYDAMSQTLTTSVFWSRPAEPWRLAIQAVENEPSIELGILGLENPMAEESLTLSGFLHVVGQDQELEPTLFTFPSRHYTHPASYRLEAIKPTGMHPKLKLALTGPLKAPGADCTLNAYFSLPRSIFIDKYQLADSNPQLLRSFNVRRVRGITGETDLEAPVWASSAWGSNALVEIDEGAALSKDSTLDVVLPVHTRYLEPKYNDTIATVTFASPSVFWACRSEEWSKMSNSPFDRTRLGWEHLFPEQTMYYHLSPSEESWKSIDVPVLDLRHAEIVKVGTVAVIGAGFFWALWKLFSAATTSHPTHKEKKL